MDERFFTKQKKTKILETIEWDDLWWEHADDKDKKARVLLIGDSISRGYRHAVNMLFDQNIYADSLATSKSLDNASYFTLINYVISQQPDCQVIHFNNGLHGWHLSIQEYRECYQKFIRFFQEMYPEKKLYEIMLCKYYPDVPGEKILVQGVVDCAIIDDDGITVIDFKSDHVTSLTLESVTNRYREQICVYVNALEEIYQKPIKAAYLYFFRMGKIVQIKG